MLWEIGNLVTKRDESRIESIQSNHGHGQAIAHLKDALVVGNETPLTVSFDTDNIGERMDEVVFDVL